MKDDMQGLEEEQEEDNLFSKLPQTHKRQDDVQKKIWKEEDSCLEENLIKEDQNLEDLSKSIIQKCLRLVYENDKNISIAESKIESIIQSQIKNQAKRKGLEFLDKLYFNVPSFIIKNIQLYETIFSLLYHHPCYILNLLKTNAMSVFHLKALVDQLFKNSIDVGPSNFTLITLTIKCFKHEYSSGSIQLNDIKNIQQSSLFWHLYTLLFERQKTTVEYFKQLVQNTMGSDICLQLYMAARMQFHKDNPKQLSNLLDYLQGTTKEIQIKAELLLKTIQPLMHQISSDYEHYCQANQQIFTEELLYVHSKIVKFAKKFTLKKHALTFRQEKQKNQNNSDLNFSSEFQQKEDQFFIERQIQKKLQDLELSLDNKLNNFIFLISYGFVIHILEYLDHFDIALESKYYPILRSANNIKIIAELLERFITKSSIKINNKCFDDINQFLLDRKEVKRIQKKKDSTVKTKAGHRSGQASVDGSEVSSDNSSDGSRQDNVNTFQETQAESYEEDQNLDAIIDRLQKSLYSQTDFELSVSQIQSLIESSSSLQQHKLQISLHTLFQIHNIYTENHSNSDLFVITQDKLDKAKITEKFNKFDPIYVIFQYLQFDPITIEDFQTEILERKVNLKLSNDLIYFSYSVLKTSDFYKCLDCSAILPSHYLPSNQQVMIKNIRVNMKDQWKCSKGHMNSLRQYVCSEYNCDEFIEENSIKNFRLIKYYNVNREYGFSFMSPVQKGDPNEPKTEAEIKEEADSYSFKEIILLIYKVLRQCDPLKEGENEYIFFDKFRKKPKLRDNPILKNDVNRLIELLESQSDEIEDLQSNQMEGMFNSSNQQHNNKSMDQDDINSVRSQDDELEVKQMQATWNEKFKYYKEFLLKILDNRKIHSERQRLVKRALTHADAHLLENIAKLQDIASKKSKILEILRNSLIPESVKQNLEFQQKLQKIEEQKNQLEKKSSKEEKRKPDSFAYYTTQKLFKKNILISISFKDIQIVEIEKSIKFYIFCNNDGSFEILIVYAKEEFLDNFTSYSKHLFPNRMLLHKIYISVAQYREMKRLEYSKTNITFSTETIQITFNMNKFVHMLQKKEGKIFDLA